MPEKNRERLRALLKEHSITQAKCSRLIARETLRPCSVRTVRAWVNDETRPSSRPCPDWVVSVIEMAIKKGI